MIVHSGDFKVDLTPIDGDTINLARLGQLGQDGVLLLLCESTNADRPGYTPTENTVGASFEQIFFSNKEKRIVISTFSSNVHRVQQIISHSEKFGRKVAITGRSMVNIVGVATELGYMTVSDGVLIDIADVKKYPPEQVVDLWYSPTFRLTFLFRSGGAALERAADGSCRVRLDEPESVAGLKRLQELSRILGDSRLHWYDSRSSFRAGTMALAAAAREDVDFNAAFEWISVPLPMLPGGADRTRQANDLLCVRRQVTDFRQVAEVVRLLLSQQVQDRLGAIREGFTLRRSSAIRSFNEEDCRDAVFFSELPKIVPDHSLGWSELQRLLLTGIDRIRHGQAEPEPVATELAAAFRTIIRYS